MRASSRRSGTGSVKAFHIDYIYVAELLAARSRPLTVCSPDEWLSVSDHVPLVLDFEVDS
jgi:endonuclease/exonuclease/phosphatase family metal-dependent hydrolase